ncbi:hypothetical protein PRZ48_006423 [Zasmidium cellare]|uniref:Uncharacterized protein n=1 Tax=Zasmidium cellare TaxID=395010 RepID=A0ABR0EN23_ZASCE|nr:hypothetical protein PRZ48_006423 [Zasmidium cellare]
MGLLQKIEHKVEEKLLHKKQHHNQQIPPQQQYQAHHRTNNSTTAAAVQALGSNPITGIITITATTTPVLAKEGIMAADSVDQEDSGAMADQGKCTMEDIMATTAATKGLEEWDLEGTLEDRRVDSTAAPMAVEEWEAGRTEEDLGGLGRRLRRRSLKWR